MSQPSSSSHPIPAPPPSRSEIERKLSLKSTAATSPRTIGESPKKPKKNTSIGHTPYLTSNPMSGNDSDASSVTSSTFPPNPTSPILTPATPSVGGLSAIAERKTGTGEEFGEELELEDVEEEGGEEEEGSGSDVEGGGELESGMEGERMVKSGYLSKKQERRKAWKKKWFVLRTGKLAYYKDDREYSLSRVIDLRTVHTVAPVTVKKHPFTFGIVTNKRTFFAKANSQDEMDDWVRAMNGVRRKLSEKQEEERNKREAAKTPGAGSVPLPTRDDSHGGMMSSSPVAAGGYFAPHPPSAMSPNQVTATPMIVGAIAVPTSPMATTNTLTQQLARASIPNQPLVTPRLPTSPMMTTGPIGRSVSAASGRREMSGSSLTADYLSHTPSASLPPTLSIKTQSAAPPGVISSDEEESYFSDPHAAFPGGHAPSPVHTQPSTFDPNKVILSAYLMKRSKGRGRKFWRKRWFYLTSQGLTYTKSHMDSRPLRFIPLSSVLDALEFHPSSSPSESDSDAPGPQTPTPKPNASPPTRLGSRRVLRKDDILTTPPSSKAKDKDRGENEHTFRLITAKRTFVLCAPSEEDEIKWLAAFRALLNRERGVSMSPTSEFAPRLPVPMTAIPTITQQPPTPALAIEQSPPPPATPALGTSQGPPILEREVPSPPPPPMTRGRSATYTAVSAVADVVRRFHPEQREAVH